MVYDLNKEFINGRVKGKKLKDNSATAWVSLGCAALLGFFMWGLATALSPVLLLIKEDLFLNFSQTGLLFSFPILMLALLAIPGGIIADKLGVKKAAGVGAVVMGVGALMRGASTDFSTLLIFSTIYGVGWGLAAPNLSKVVNGWFPGKYSGTATGIYTVGITLGVAVTLSTTLPLILPSMGGWRGALYFWGILALVAAAFWWILAKNPPSAETSAHKILPTQSVWKNRAIWVVAVMLFFQNIVFYAVIGWFPAFMISKGTDATAGALITSMIIWIGIPATLVLPVLSDRFRKRKPFYWVAGLACAGLCYLMVFTNWWQDWFLALVLGVALQSAWVICFVIPLDLPKGRSVGLVSGIVLSVGYLGGLVGPYVSGVILDTFGTFVSVMYFLGIVSLVGSVVCYFGITETGKKKA